jgi:hypothetical protein
MNFGDNLRVVPDINNHPVTIAIGQSVPVELAEPIARFIYKAMSTDTLMMAPEDSEHPSELVLVLTLLKDVDTREYTELLQAVEDLLGTDVKAMRPTRGMIRTKLLNVARNYAQQTYARGGLVGVPKGRVVILEDEPSDVQKQADALKPRPQDNPSIPQPHTPNTMPEELTPPSTDAIDDEALELAVDRKPRERVKVKREPKTAAKAPKRARERVR